MTLNSVVITDCGSTTTKGIWFKKLNGKWSVVARAEAPTTVEKPVADVTVGVFNSLKALGNSVGSEFVKEQNGVNLLKLSEASDLPQHYLSTSSAGGGLQMVVIGLLSEFTGKSAERAALGAGAIVQKVVTLDSDVSIFENAKTIRDLRPDIVLFSGGTNGGARHQLEELAEILILAEPKSRFEIDSKIPLIYAGNSRMAAEIKKLLEDIFEFTVTENIRPNLEFENLIPARTAVHDIFLDHVMSQAPGYKKLKNLVSQPILSTPVAVSKMIEKASSALGKSVLAVDIGGATTDIFSIRRSKVDGSFNAVHRSVSANLGMSYSIGNVIEAAGIEKIARWLPYQITLDNLNDTLCNKMIRPTTLPETLQDLHVEQSAAREALNLSLKHHIKLEGEVEGKNTSQDMGDIFKNEKDNDFSMIDIDLVIGSGGVLSHAPNRASAGLMLLDSFRPLGVTFLGIDSIFMLPHLGILSETNVDAAVELLFSECIVPLGTVICPGLKSTKLKIGDPLFKIKFIDDQTEIEVKFGELNVIQLDHNESREIKIIPLRGDLNFGFVEQETLKLDGGKIGIILDGRCAQIERLFELENSFELNKKWLDSLNISY